MQPRVQVGFGVGKSLLAFRGDSLALLRFLVTLRNRLFAGGDLGLGFALQRFERRACRNDLTLALVETGKLLGQL